MDAFLADLRAALRLILSNRGRRRIYRIAVALGPLLVLLGYTTDHLWAAILGVIEAALVPALAAKNTPTDKDTEDDLIGREMGA